MEFTVFGLWLLRKKKKRYRKEFKPSGLLNFPLRINELIDQMYPKIFFLKSPLTAQKPYNMKIGCCESCHGQTISKSKHKKNWNSKKMKTAHYFFLFLHNDFPKPKLFTQITNLSFNFITNDTGVVSKRSKETFDLVEYNQSQIFRWLWNLS